MQPARELTDVVQNVRQMYLQLLAQAMSTAETAGTCLYASVFLAHAVNQFTPYAAKVRGGDGEGDGGYFDASGVAHGHYWVEARGEQPTEAWVLDVTADQFGAEAVVMMPLSMSRENYRPGSQLLVDEHAKKALLAG
jgi:hypothetical protein